MLGHAIVGLCYSMKGQYPAAIERLQEVWQLDDLPLYLGYIAEAYALSGNQAEARKLMDS